MPPKPKRIDDQRTFVAAPAHSSRALRKSKIDGWGGRGPQTEAASLSVRSRKAAGLGQRDHPVGGAFDSDYARHKICEMIPAPNAVPRRRPKKRKKHHSHRAFWIASRSRSLHGFPGFSALMVVKRSSEALDWHVYRLGVFASALVRLPESVLDECLNQHAAGRVGCRKAL